jgi:hypothetical protein
VFRIVPHSQKSRKNFLVFFGTFCGTQKSEKAISVVALTLFRFWGLMSGNKVPEISRQKPVALQRVFVLSLHFS